MHACTTVLRLGLMAGLWMAAVGCSPQQRPVPVLKETFQSTTEVEAGSTVTARVKAEDPKGLALSFSWESQDGTLSTPVSTATTSEVLWNAPPCARVESLPTLTATVTNSEGLATTHDFTLKGIPLCTPFWKAVSAGKFFSLALDDKGRVWAWGGYSQLWTPIVVKGLEAVVAVAAGEDHSLALKQDGTVWQWRSPLTTPGQVAGLGGVVALAAGGDTSLALKADGTVWAWGSGWNGQLGDGTVTPYRATPGRVVGLDGVVSIAAGMGHALAVKSDGTVWGWGSSTLGPFDGEAIFGRHPTPRRLHGLTGVVSAAVGEAHSLVLKADGTVWAWGDNLRGQLGDGTRVDRSTPVQAAGLGEVVAIVAGAEASLAMKSDGTAWRWGDNSDGSNNYPLSPVPMSGFDKVVALARGGLHTLVLKPDGTVWAWGNNTYGQLGRGKPHDRSTPLPVVNVGEVRALSVGVHHSVALKPDGTVWHWGGTTDHLTPARVEGLEAVVAVAAQVGRTLVVKGDGTVWGWGDNMFGELGDGTRRERTTTLTQASALSGVVAVAAGWRHTLALKADGTVWAWGSNDSGQLGDGIGPDPDPRLVEPRLTPGPVVHLEGVVAVAAGGYHSLALKADGTVWAWGSNSAGQLGDGTDEYRVAPVQVAGLGGVVAVSAGSGHSLALKADGSLWAWGSGLHGQVGDGFLLSRQRPVRVSTLSGVVAMCAGVRHSVAVKADGSLWAWGGNDSGQLGNTTTAAYSTLPRKLSDFSGGAAVSCGWSHSVVMKADGSLWAWGASDSGLTGDGLLSSTTPFPVGGVRGNTGG